MTTKPASALRPGDVFLDHLGGMPNVVQATYDTTHNGRKALLVVARETSRRYGDCRIEHYLDPRAHVIVTR